MLEDPRAVQHEKGPVGCGVLELSPDPDVAVDGIPVSFEPADLKEDVEDIAAGGGVSRDLGQQSQATEGVGLGIAQAKPSRTVDAAGVRVGLDVGRQRSEPRDLDTLFATVDEAEVPEWT